MQKQAHNLEKYVFSQLCTRPHCSTVKLYRRSTTKCFGVTCTGRPLDGGHKHEESVLWVGNTSVKLETCKIGGGRSLLLVPFVFHTFLNVRLMQHFRGNKANTRLQLSAFVIVPSSIFCHHQRCPLISLERRELHVSFMFHLTLGFHNPSASVSLPRTCLLLILGSNLNLFSRIGSICQ